MSPVRAQHVRRVRANVGKYRAYDAERSEICPAYKSRIGLKVDQHTIDSLSEEVVCLRLFPRSYWLPWFETGPSAFFSVFSVCAIS